MRLGAVGWCEGCRGLFSSVVTTFHRLFYSTLVQQLALLFLHTCCLDAYSLFWMFKWFGYYLVRFFLLSVALFAFRPICLFVCCGFKKRYTSLYRCSGLERSTRGAVWLMSPSPGVRRFNAPAPPLPPPPSSLYPPFSAQWTVTCDPKPRGIWGPRPPPRINCPSTCWCVNELLPVSVFYGKMRPTTRKRPGQVKWYCPQQRLYIATQTGPQDEYSVFWLNTETARPRRQNERLRYRQDSGKVLILFNMPIKNKLSQTGCAGLMWFDGFDLSGKSRAKFS